MKRLLSRVCLGILTFGLGWAAHIPATKTQIMATTQTSVSPPPPFTFGLRFSDESSQKPTASRRISQEAIISIPGIGPVRVRAFEPKGEGPDFSFTDVRTGKAILTEYFSGDRVNDHSMARFRVISVKGFSNPLVLMIVMNPGVSDCGWEFSVAGVVNRELEVLSYHHLFTSNEGGFFIGNLGQGEGLGIAQWDFVWGEGESHVSPHQYEITMYKWDGWRFEWHRVFRTRKTYTSGRAALRASGLHYMDIRKTFPEWEDLETW